MKTENNYMYKVCHRGEKTDIIDKINNGNLNIVLGNINNHRRLPKVAIDVKQNEFGALRFLDVLPDRLCPLCEM